MLNIFTFSLDEIPLVICDGVEAGFVNGEAQIEYSRDGEWMIVGIALDGASVRIGDKLVFPKMPCPDAIAAIIDARLNKEWHDRVQEAVREQLEQDHIDALEQRADARRDDRMMGL